MEKEGLELGSFTEKVAAVCSVDSALLLVVNHNLEQKKFSETEKCTRTSHGTRKFGQS
jgi:hypothetical protein